jgi:hypothetical protein
VVQEYSHKIYFVILDTHTSFYKFLKFETISGIKTIENELKFTAQCRAEIGLRLQRLPAAVLSSSITAERWMRQARGAEAGLTDVVARWLSAAASSPEARSAASPASSRSCGGGREG